MVLRAQAALPALAEAGISAEIIELCTVSPWDREAVFASAAKTGRVIVAHEAVRNFGRDRSKVAHRAPIQATGVSRVSPGPGGKLSGTSIEPSPA